MARTLNEIIAQERSKSSTARQAHPTSVREVLMSKDDVPAEDGATLRRMINAAITEVLDGQQSGRFIAADDEGEFL